MSTTEHPPIPDSIEQLLAEEHAHLARLDEQLAAEHEHTEELERRTRFLTGLESVNAVAGLGAVLGVIVLAVLLLTGVLGGDEQKTVQAAPAGAAMAMTADTADASYSGPVEAYKRPDPTLPAVPAGKVKTFEMDVYEHVTKVSDDKPATRVWSYGVNGVLHRGTGVSTPMVVEQGDMVKIVMRNGSSKDMQVDFPHSIDFHSSEVSPEENFKTVGAGKTVSFEFEAKHVGVFMYHCATDPVLMHTGAGMVGAMIVKPRDLPAVDKELWITQQEYYIGKPGGNADMAKMEALNPDVVAFNGYAFQYKKNPIPVKTGEKVRMYVMNAGPSIWSAFHVIGTVFDKTVIEGQVGKDAQTVNLAPSQGGWVEFTLDEPGTYTFVNHSFGGMVKGAAGAMKAS